MSAPNRQPHVFWKAGLWCATPTWTKAPDLSIIASLSRRYLSTEQLTVEFLGEGALNKAYTITTADCNNINKAYVFRVTLPVEPFYKTSSEVATLAYMRRYTTIPVPRVIAYSATVDNELGFEWILMEKVPGVSLPEIWYAGMDDAARDEVVKTVARFFSEMREKCRFASIGSLYFRKDLEEKGAEVTMMETGTDDFVIGPIVTRFFFVGGRRLLVERDRGPYSHEYDYIHALTEVVVQDIQHLQNSTPPDDDDDDQAFEYDKYLAEDAHKVIQATRELQEVLPSIFPRDNPTTTTEFALYHRHLDLSNIIVDPTTYQITGIVDWECVSVCLSWEDPYPWFLRPPEVDWTPEPLAPDVFLLYQWEDLQNMRLRKVFDGVVVSEQRGGGVEADELKREFMEHLTSVQGDPDLVIEWLASYRERHGTVIVIS
jgi:aminoglycoside phosphotransferase